MFRRIYGGVQIPGFGSSPGRPRRPAESRSQHSTPCSRLGSAGPLRGDEKVQDCTTAGKVWGDEVCRLGYKFEGG